MSKGKTKEKGKDGGFKDRSTTKRRERYKNMKILRERESESEREWKRVKESERESEREGGVCVLIKDKSTTFSQLLLPSRWRWSWQC